MDYKGWTLNNRGLLRAGTGQIGEAVEDSTLNGSDSQQIRTGPLHPQLHALPPLADQKREGEEKERETEERKKNATPSTDYIQYSGREVGEVRGVERGKVNRQRVLPGPTFR